MDIHTYDPSSLADKGRQRIFRIVVYSLLTVTAMLYVLPLLIVLMNSFRDLQDINRNSLIGLPSKFSIDAWVRAWGEVQIGGNEGGISPYFITSIKMVVPATLISTALGAINGYALSIWRFRGHKWVFGIMLFGVFIPGQMMLLPWSMILGKLGMSNSWTGLVLVHVVFGIGFVTLFFRNFYLQVPDEIIQAARIDGAGFWRIFWKIILPLSPPIIIVTIIWEFTKAWNEYLYAATFTSGYNRPITAALMAISGTNQSAPEYDIQSAAVIIAALPTLAIYIFGGRYFLRGLTAGAVKG
jgi:glucose/mannose transport system permease protein